MIHTLRAEIEQLSLAFEIMVKCSYAGPSNKSVNIFNAVVLGNGNLFTLWNRIIYTYTAHQSKLALKFSFTANMIKQ